MGDRVAVIGGTTVGRDYLPPPYNAVDWAPADLVNDEGDPVFFDWGSTRGDGTLYPWGFNPEDYLRYHLRVRKWSFTLTANLRQSVAISPPPASAPFFEWQTGTATISCDVNFASIAQLDPGYFVPTREAQLVCSSGRRYLSVNLYSDACVPVSRVDPAPSDPSPLVTNVSGAITSGFVGNSGGTSALFMRCQLCLVSSIGADSGVGYPQINTDEGTAGGGFIDDQWFPLIMFEAGISGGSFSPAATSAWSGRDYTTDELGTFSLEELTASIYGETVPASADAAPGWIGFTALDVSVEPAEFWPYAYKNGDPVYDEDDGSRLEPGRDPLNG